MSNAGTLVITEAFTETVMVNKIAGRFVCCMDGSIAPEAGQS